MTKSQKNRASGVGRRGSTSTQSSQLTARSSNLSFAFFGTSHIAVYVLDELERAGFTPVLVVILPDKPRGRGLDLAPSDVKQWAFARGINVLQPEKLDAAFVSQLEARRSTLCIVVDYGKILPKKLLDIPKYGFLNVHPSLLPRLRGPSPMRSAILHDERQTGVSIIRMDEKIDHGPVVAQKKIAVPDWPVKNSELEALLLPEGGRLLARILPEYIAGHTEPREQNHDLATYSEKFPKEDGLLDLSDDPYANLLKIKAFEGWPGTFAFFERGGKKIRVAILDAHIDDGNLVIDTVKPEGKREMPYADFIRSGAGPL